MPNACPVLLASVLALSANAAPTVVCALGPEVSSYNAYEDQPPTGDAMDLARQASAALMPACTPKCPRLVINRNPTAPNVILVFDADRAKMAYAPQFFSDVYAKYGDGAIIAFIAHMLGHAMDPGAAAGWMKGNWTPELRADAWAGCALAKTSSSVRSLEAALTAVSRYPSASHPDWPLRIPALRLGYTHCGGDGSQFDGRAAAVGRN
jgi:hypothetical protein